MTSRSIVSGHPHPIPDRSRRIRSLRIVLLDQDRTVVNSDHVDMTDLVAGPGAAIITPASVLEAANASADEAARSAGVQIRQLVDLGDLRDVCSLIDRTWSPDGDEPLITVSVLRALAHAGNYVAGAFCGGELVGAAVAFLGDRGRGWELHSHIAAVVSGMRGRNVGFALKLHQRGWALMRDIPVITWTFDPLSRRNAYFNLVKLGAVPTEYLQSFYGVMRDGINAGDDSDRLLVEWHLGAPRTAQVCAGPSNRESLDDVRARAAIGLDADSQGLPVVCESTGGVVLVHVPPDVERLRREHQESARAWRRALREVLGGLMGEGATVTGFLRDGWYVIGQAAPGANGFPAGVLG